MDKYLPFTKVEQKGIKKYQKTLNFNLGNSFMVVTFKIFFPQKKFALLQIGP